METMTIDGTSLVVLGAILVLLTNARTVGTDPAALAGLSVGAGGLLLVLSVGDGLVRQRCSNGRSLYG